MDGGWMKTAGMKGGVGVYMALLDDLIILACVFYMPVAFWFDYIPKDGKQLKLGEKIIVAALLLLILSLCAVLHSWKLFKVYSAFKQSLTDPLRRPLLALRILIVFYLAGFYLFYISRHALDFKSATTKETVLSLSADFVFMALYYHVEYTCLKSLCDKLLGSSPPSKLPV